MEEGKQNPNRKFLESVLSFFERVIELLKDHPLLLVLVAFGVLIGFVLPIVLYPIIQKFPPTLQFVFATSLLLALVILFIFSVNRISKQQRLSKSNDDTNRQPKKRIASFHITFFHIILFSIGMMFSFSLILFGSSIQPFLAHRTAASPGYTVIPSPPAPIGVVNKGKSAPQGSVFDLNKYYVASGKMGDIGDVEIADTVFTYTTKGRGPHEYEWKYDLDGKAVERPAGFGGVVWLSPANAFGTDSQGGYDLTGFKTLKWEARSIGADVNVEFFIGGINWIWKQTDAKPARVPAPYPDTMPRIGFGIKKLTPDWQQFEVSLADQPTNNFLRVVGGFGWVANWGSNEVESNEDGTGANTNKVNKFEVRNIRYER
jgi:hypothetical protein